MKIKKDVYNDLTKLEFEMEHVVGLTRDTELFGLLKKAHKNNYTKVKVIRNNDNRFQIEFFDGKEWVKHNTSFVTIKSIFSSLSDFVFFDIENKRFDKVSDLKTNSMKIYDYFKDEYNILNPINKYDRLIHGEYNEDNFMNTIKSWNKYNDSLNPNFRILARINSIIWNHVEKYSLENLFLGDKAKIKKQYKTNYDSLKKLVEKYIEIFVYKDFNQEETFNSNEILLKTKTNLFTLKLKEIIWLIKEGKLSIPTFQREYIWKISKIIPFLNSINNDFPIGSLLISETNFAINGKNLVFEGIKKYSNKKIANDSLIVLDGQQRLTTLTLILEYETLKRKMNKISKYENLNKRLAIINDIFVYNDIFYSKRDLKKQNGVKTTSIDKHWILHDNNKETVMKKLRNFQLPFIKAKRLDKNHLKDLIEIFRNINIGSSNLTSIDIMHAAFWDADENKEFQLLDELKEIKEKDWNKSFQIDDKMILRVWKLVFDFKYKDFRNENKKKCPSLKESDMLAISVNVSDALNWMELMKITKLIIKNTIHYIHEEAGWVNIKQLPNIAFFINIASLIIQLTNLKNIDQFNYKNHLKEFTKWFRWSILMTIIGEYKSGTGTKIISDIEKIWGIKEIPLFSSREESNIKTKWEMLLENVEYKKQNLIYKLAIGLLVTQNPVSLIDGETLVNAKGNEWENVDMDQHHFLPKKNKKFKDLNEINNIGNIILISSDENRRVIKNVFPSEYLLKDVKNENKRNNLLKNIAKTHLINIDYLKKCINDNQKDDFISLILERNKKIISEITKKWGLEEYI